MENQRPALGFLLALLATATWGTLPIAAQQVLKFIDAPTLVWIRFTVAASVLLFFLAAAGRLPKRRDFSWRGSLNARNHLGGTAPEQVRFQVKRWREMSA